MEVVGVALAVLPLLISAAEHYDKCVGPFTRYTRFPRQASRFLESLDLEKVIFQSHCQILLQELVAEDVATCMLRAADHPSWQDHNLKQRLAGLLEKSRWACITIVKEINEQLRSIEPECQRLMAAAKVENRELDVMEGTSVRWGARITKLRFSVSKPRLDQSLKDLAALNAKLGIIASQLLRFEKRQRPDNLQDSLQIEREVAKFNIIQKVSRQIYLALGQACTRQSQPSAHTRAEVEYRVLDDGQSAQVKFRMVLSGSGNKSEPISFIVDTTLDDLVGDEDAGHLLDQGEFDHAFRLQLHISPENTTRGKAKSVRFESRIMSSKTHLPLVTIANPFCLGGTSDKDFYEHLHKCKNEPVQPHACIGNLGSSGLCKTSVFLATRNDEFQPQQAISLYKLVSTISEQTLVTGLPIYERLRLAKVLTVAVLQYRATPWLQTSWKSHDVIFFGTDTKSLLRKTPALEAPHLITRVQRSEQDIDQDQTQRDCTGGARNALLYSLGIVLLELAYWTSWESLQTCNSEGDYYADFFQARALVKSGRSDMGPQYDSIVEKLIECDFACGADLDTSGLQAAVYRDVFCPLDKLEAGFRALQAGL